MLEAIDQEVLSQVQGGAGLASRSGEAIGFAGGVAVTAGLGMSSKWSQQVDGQPEGFQKRHEAVLGPKIGAHAAGMSDGAAKDFVSGVAAGATAAPGWSFNHGL